jgi:hypothetical protein
MMGVRKMGLEDVDWIYLAQDRDWWRAVVETVREFPCAVVVTVHRAPVCEGPVAVALQTQPLYSDGSTPGSA